MTQPIQFSIITICYNDVNGLMTTLNSVQRQSWREFEHIIIDGGSQDGTPELLQSRDKQIRYWVSEPDRGISNAFNKGIHACKGEFLLFLNAGDYFYSDTVLKNVFPLLKVQGAIYWFRSIFYSPLRQRCFPCRAVYSNHNLLFFQTYPQPSTIYSRRAIEKTGLFDEKLKNTMDTEYLIRAQKKHVPIIMEEEKLTIMELGGISQTDIWRTIKEGFVIRWQHGYRIAACVFTFLRTSKQIIKTIIMFKR